MKRTRILSLLLTSILLAFPMSSCQKNTLPATDMSTYVTKLKGDLDAANARIKELEKQLAALSKKPSNSEETQTTPKPSTDTTETPETKALETEAPQATQYPASERFFVGIFFCRTQNIQLTRFRKRPRRKAHLYNRYCKQGLD